MVKKLDLKDVEVLHDTDLTYSGRLFHMGRSVGEGPNTGARCRTERLQQLTASSCRMAMGGLPNFAAEIRRQSPKFTAIARSWPLGQLQPIDAIRVMPDNDIVASEPSW